VSDNPLLDTLEVRSYRTVFDLERRVYRIDHLRLNPGGVPLRGMLYFLALLVVIAVAGRLPLTGAIVRLAPWYLRDLALPGLTAALLTLIRVDGRPFHLAVRALVRHGISSNRVCRLGLGAVPRSRWHPPDLLMLPDGSDHRVRRLRYRGPGAAVVTVAHERIEGRRGRLARLLRRTDLTVRQLEPACALGRAKVVELGDGCRLALAPARTRARSSMPVAEGLSVPVAEGLSRPVGAGARSTPPRGRGATR
jgi:hypothetical protein